MKKITILTLLFLIYGIVLSTCAMGNESKININQNISFECRDTDIKDVIRAIAEMCSVNIVAPDDIKGKITISLKEVELKHALNAIIKVNNYVWELKNNIIIIETTPPLKTEFIQLKYADSTTISQLIESIKSEKGSIMVDVRSNKLVIIDLSTHIEKMKKIISELDAPVPQVTIYAKIIDINVSDAIDLGLTLSNDNVNGNPSDVSTANSTNTSFKMHEATADGEETNYNIGRDTDYTTEKGRSNAYTSNLRKSTGAGTFGYDYKNFENNKNTITDISNVGTLTTSVISAALSDIISVQLDALIATGRSLLLAAPTITTLNNETASIIIGDKVGIKEQTQTTTGTTETVRFQDVGTKLEVTPQINIDGYITMSIKPEISSVIEYTEDTVRFRTREARTKVRVKDGQTVIIGGLIKNEEEISRRRVPFLSRIPILGIPFRAKYDTGQQTELVVFLSPSIINLEDAPHKNALETVDGKRNEEALAKEEELIHKFTYGGKWGDEVKSSINEGVSLEKKLFKEAIKIKRKSKRLSNSREKAMLQKSLGKFILLIETYPDSEYTPQSLYEAAGIYIKLNNNKKANEFYNKILDEFPESHYYNKAKRKNKKLIQ